MTKLNLTMVTEFTESRQYRSKQAFKQTTARVVCDQAFLDMIGIWILLNEFESAPDGVAYAGKTVAYNRFNMFRQSANDLYLNLHIITEKRTDLLASASDVTLLSKIQLDVPGIVRYLRMAATNSLSRGYVRQTLQRLEQSLYIENSNYRSIRRLAQSWPTLTAPQKTLVLTRMSFFYRAHARKSEIGGLIMELAKNKGFINPAAQDPESSALKVGAAMAAGGAVGFAAGRRLGNNLV